MTEYEIRRQIESVLDIHKAQTTTCVVEDLVGIVQAAVLDEHTMMRELIRKTREALGV